MIRSNLRTLAGSVITGAVFAAAPVVCGAQAGIAAPRTSVDEGARPLTLEEAVQLAQRNLPSTVTARGQERTAAAARRAAKGALIPSLSISASTGYSTGTTLNSFDGTLTRQGGNPWSYGNGASMNLELFDGGRRFSEISRTGFTAEAASVAVVTARYDAALQAKQQFYAALAAREAEAAARAQLEQADQQLRASTARVGAGVVTKSDSLRSAIQVGNARLAVLTAQNDLRVANSALTRVTGSMELVTANPADTAFVPIPTITEADLLRIIPDAPAIQLAEANYSIAKAARRTQKAQYLPTISMSVGYNFNAASKGFTGGNLVLPFQKNPSRQNVSFSFSYPLFNGFTREANAVNASVALDNAEAALRDAKLVARSNLSTQLRALNNANARVQVQLQSIAAAEEDLRVQQQRYALGASTLLDLLTSQTQLNVARQALIQARFDARVAKAQLESLLGREL